MSQLHAGSLGIVDQLKKGMEEQEKRDRIAITAACGSDFTIPKTLEQAAGIIVQLKRDSAEWKSKHNKIITEFQQETQKLPNVISDILKGQPESRVNDVTSLKSFIARIIQERDKARSLDVLENVRQTLLGIGYNEIPGFIGYFEKNTPLLACAEAASVLITLTDGSIDNTPKENYLLRRGWTRNLPGSWRDPVGGGVADLKSAVLVQTKRDIKPFSGLGTKNWRGPNPEKVTE